MVLLRSITSLSSHNNPPGTFLVGFEAVEEELTIVGDWLCHTQHKCYLVSTIPASAQFIIAIRPLTLETSLADIKSKLTPIRGAIFFGEAFVCISRLKPVAG